ncbi:hypothetical protein BTO30_04255 [Domibacillus antri]|uniref:GGDEF domain-containing protein n=1 Tax=Domibacillus antri TaxID=1714264 RepID=A0A1Q8Q7C1_9BACI|nr:GGDEF domain-containing protein [Domibacillus antri]OLN23192.1 hypothetical protein BTO30_04255 [Domibacillus antri]
MKFLHIGVIIMLTALPVVLDVWIIQGRHVPLIWSLFIVPLLMIIHKRPTWKTAILSGGLFMTFIYTTEIIIGHWSAAESVYLIGGTVVNGAIFLTAAYYRLKYEEALAEIKKLTHVDALTGLHNRRFFEESINKSMLLSRQKDVSILLILLDLDHFKKVNDTHGHVCGDLILKKTAETIQRNIQETDAVVRLGGEEFAVLCIHSSIADGRALAERIIGSVEKLDIEYNGQKVPVTISAGMSRYDGEPLEDFIDKTDKALYEAKRTGRNRLVVV